MSTPMPVERGKEGVALTDDERAVLHGFVDYKRSKTLEEEAAWLRRVIQWCRPRLSRESYRQQLDRDLAEGPREIDHNEPKVVQSGYDIDRFLDLEINTGSHTNEPSLRELIRYYYKSWNPDRAWWLRQYNKYIHALASAAPTPSASRVDRASVIEECAKYHDEQGRLFRDRALEAYSEPGPLPDVGDARDRIADLHRDSAKAIRALSAPQSQEEK